uniref:Uncharacterized protein n=1 Tax=Glossina brevipalpis TaxID=37001 RepID=A0A1A9WWR8_9MUSC
MYACGSSSSTAAITMFLHLFPIHAACLQNFYSIFHMQAAYFEHEYRIEDSDDSHVEVTSKSEETETQKEGESFYMRFRLKANAKCFVRFNLTYDDIPRKLLQGMTRSYSQIPCDIK